jgi:hypothetical protein
MPRPRVNASPPLRRRIMAQPPLPRRLLVLRRRMMAQPQMWIFRSRLQMWAKMIVPQELKIKGVRSNERLSAPDAPFRPTHTV